MKEAYISMCVYTHRDGRCSCIGDDRRVEDIERTESVVLLVGYWLLPPGSTFSTAIGAMESAVAVIHSWLLTPRWAQSATITDAADDKHLLGP